MDTKIKQKQTNIQKKILLFLICISSIFMSVGYATINSISFDFEGIVHAEKQEGIFITDYQYQNNINANVNESNIEQIYQTVMKCKIVLSETDLNSNITYQITIYNDTEYDYLFKEVVYDLGNTYDNEQISFYLSDIEAGTILNKKSSIKFNITFNYNNITEITNNILNAYLKFDFELAPYVAAEIDYTGSTEKFIALHDGIYKLEVWGAQGGIAEIGNLSNIGGYGAYSTGEIELNNGDELYIAVGGSGYNYPDFTAPDPPEELIIDITPGGFNGGGYSVYSGRGSGGGATSICKKLISDGQLVNYKNNIDDVIIVAGGGGGGQVYNAINNIDYSGKGGHGGGYIGGDGTILSTTVYGYGTGGTQTEGGTAIDIAMSNLVYSITDGSFGIGASVKSEYKGYYIYSSAGGGGFYGGGAIEHGPAGGGSGYIGNSMLKNKSMYCYDCSISSEESTKTIANPNVSESPISYYSKIGNGYAKITYLRKKET